MSGEEKETFSFEDGVQHNVDDLSEEGKLVYNKLIIIKKNKQEFEYNSKFEQEKLNILQAAYAHQLKTIVEPEERKIEPVSNKKKD